MSTPNPYVRRPAPASAARAASPDGLADVLERVLDKGLVIAGDIQLNLLDIELLTIKVRLLVASADTAQQMGIDWWKHDPFLSGRDRELAQENAVLRDRVDQLEATLGRKLAPGEPSPGDLVGEGATERGAPRGQPRPTGALTGRGDSRDQHGRGTGDAGRAEAEAEEVVLEPTGDADRLVVRGDERRSLEVHAETDRSVRTKAELQEELRGRDLPVSGTKTELITRLEDSDRG